MVLWPQETLFSFAHVRGSSPPRLHKALVKGKQDEAPRRSRYPVSLETEAAEP